MKNQKSGIRLGPPVAGYNRMPENMALVRVIRRLRERRGWSQNRLAKESRICRTMRGCVETEKCVPSAETIARVARAFGRSFGF